MGMTPNEGAREALKQLNAIYRPANCRIKKSITSIRIALDHPGDPDLDREARRALELEVHMFSEYEIRELLQYSSRFLAPGNLADDLESFLRAPAPSPNASLGEGLPWLERLHPLLSGLLGNATAALDAAPTTGDDRGMSQFVTSDSETVGSGTIAPMASPGAALGGGRVAPVGDPSLDELLNGRAGYLGLSFNRLRFSVQRDIDGKSGTVDLSRNQIEWWVAAILASRRGEFVTNEELKAAWRLKHQRKPSDGTVAGKRRSATPTHRIIQLRPQCHDCVRLSWAFMCIFRTRGLGSATR